MSDRDGPIQAVSCHDVGGMSEHVENIQRVFNMSPSKLAAFLGVSHQTVYQWLRGDVKPDVNKQELIVALSRIADKFQAAEISRAESLLKMKVFGDKSLLDILMSGEEASEYVTTLIQEAKIMEASYGRSGLSLSKAEPTNDWQSSVSIPAFSEKD